MKILYIEDDRDLLRISKLAIADSFPDIELAAAENYTEAALLLTRGGPFDLIVSDFRFPGIDHAHNAGGVDFYALANHKAHETPFVFLSGSSKKLVLDTLRDNGLEIDENHIYLKPNILPNVIEDAQKNFMPPRPQPAPSPTPGPGNAP